MTYLQERQAAGEIVTGLLYVNPDGEDLHDRLGTVRAPLNALGDAELCPGSAALEKLNAGLR
jgi:2-oxoglutarate ferredoxin oxidoreductase subunit beta